MEKKKSNVALYIISTIVLLAIGIGIGCLIMMLVNDNQTKKAPIVNNSNSVDNSISSNATSVMNNIMDTSQNTNQNTTNNSVTEGKLTKVDFTIASVERVENGYKINVHLLADEPRTISKDEYMSLLWGSKIKFRGKVWETSKSDSTYTMLKETNTQNESIALERYKEDVETYNIWSIAGKETKLRDYKSDEITSILVSTDIKCGDTFETFEYDAATDSIKVKDYTGNYVAGETMEAFDSRMRSEYYNNPTRAGECTGYFLNDKLVAINSHVATGP